MNEEATVIHSREELMELLDLDEADMAAGQAEQEAYIRAWHLTQLRKAQGQTQQQVAEQMHVSQPRVHEVEKGDLARTTIAVLRSYVEALGGELEITAHIGENRYRVA